MQLSGTIRIRPADDARSVDDLDTRDVVGIGTTYDDARAELDAQVPDGWQLLFVRSSS